MNFQSKSLVAVFLVIIALGLGYFGVLPKWTSYKNAKTQLDDAQNVYKQLLDAQKQVNSFLSEYKQHANDATVIDNALPLDKTKVYNILKNLEDIGKSSGLTLADLALVEPTDSLGAAQNTIRPIDVSFSSSGNSAAFKEFIKKLEANLRIMDIQSVTLSSEESENGGGNTIKNQVKFRTYYQK